MTDVEPDLTERPWHETPGVATGGIIVRFSDGRAAYVPAVAIIGEDGEVDISPTGDGYPITVVDDLQEQP